jgi:FSR family fosmidomycin resistance protein-like MFS transporter
MNLKLIVILSISHVFLDLTGGALPALMPFLKDALSLNYTEVGAVIMISNLASSVLQPGFGYFSDKKQVKWLLPVSVILTYMGFSFIGIAPSYRVLLILVVISGLGLACYHPESFKVMHFLTGSRKATGMSFFQVGGNLGLALGPLFITYAIQIAGLRGTMFFLAIGLPVLAMLLIFFKELTQPLEKKMNSDGQEAITSRTEKSGAWSQMGFLVLAVTMRSWAHMGLMAFTPFYYISVLQGDALTAGKLVFVFLMGGAVGTVIGGMAADKLGHRNYFALSMILSIPLLFLFLQVTGVWVFVVLFVIGLVLISSFSVTVVMGQHILSNRLGVASGLMLGFSIGMGGIGAGVLGLVADAWGVLTVLKLIVVMPAVGLIPIMMVRDPLKPATSVARAS